MSRTVQNRTVADPTDQRRCRPMESTSANGGQPQFRRWCGTKLEMKIWNRRYHRTDRYIKYILTRHHFRYFAFYFLNKTALFHLILLLLFFFKPWKQHRFVHSPNPNSLRINTFFSLRPLSSLVGWLSPLVATLSSLTTTQANNLLEILKRRVLGLKA